MTRTTKALVTDGACRLGAAQRLRQTDPRPTDAPWEEVGRRAAQLLFEEIQTREAGEPLQPRSVRFEPKLVVQASTA
jgi:hypothetical protein